MKALYFFLIPLILCSCNRFKENGIDVLVKNNTSQSIIAVKCYTSEKLALLEFDSVDPQELKKGFLSMESNRSDGDYILEFIMADGQRQIMRQGHYINGNPQENTIEYNIEPSNNLVTLIAP